MNKGKYDALDIANYIINYSIDQGAPISNLKLQKLLYYVQVASLVENDRPMFNDDISAWKYGPVVESVYHNFKWYVDKPIDDKITEKDDVFGFSSDLLYRPENVIEDEDQKMIENIIAGYKNYSALSMVKKTHNEAPWKNAYESNQDYIEEEEIQRFYGGNNKNLIYGKQ